MRPFRPILALLLLAMPSLLFARTQQPNVKPIAAPASGYRAEFFANLDEVEGKLMDLATTIPAEKYGWRPGSDVRSISEVYMHVAGGNYFLTTFVGAKAPTDLPKDLEAITDKQRILAEMRRSFQHVREVVARMSDADLDKSVRLFGKPTTQRAVLTTLLSHLHEHLGQSIAYARMNGVAPPWSR